MAAEYRRRRDFIHPAIACLPGVACAQPEGGFYVFPDVSRCLSKQIPDTLTLGARLLEEKAVAIVPGEGFYAPGTFRLSFATAFERSAGGRAPDRRVLRRASAGAEAAVSEAFEPRQRRSSSTCTRRARSSSVCCSRCSRRGSWCGRSTSPRSRTGCGRRPGAKAPGSRLVTLFFPMNRVEKMERDETVGGLEGLADRFRRATGRSVAEAAGVDRRSPRRRSGDRPRARARAPSVAEEGPGDRSDGREERDHQEQVAVLADRAPVAEERRRPRRAVAAGPERRPAVAGAACRPAASGRTTRCRRTGRWSARPSPPAPSRPSGRRTRSRRGVCSTLIERRGAGRLLLVGSGRRARLSRRILRRGRRAVLGERQRCDGGDRDRQQRAPHCPGLLCKSSTARGRARP